MERLCKIVWNSKHWIQPCERSWNPSYKNDKNKGYELKHGFVHEDWLFNPQFLIDGYQYGYIEGVSKLNSSIKTIETIFLFTRNPATTERFYVGELYNVERIFYDDALNSKVKKSISSYHLEMVNQLRNLDADYKILQKFPFRPNLRFRIKTQEIFPDPIPIVSSWFASKYNRTMPMKMNEPLKALLNDLEKQKQFKFTPSSPFEKVNSYVRHTKTTKTNVSKLHLEIEQCLYNYLLNDGITKIQIACDTLSFGGKLADMVVKTKPNNYHIYEIKTDADLRRGLREAVGQLIDYATWEKSIRVEKITAVLLETNLSDNIKDFISRIKDNLKISFEILLYNKDIKTFSPI